MMNELSQKYDFLLHPIKDLTKNWNVDIASVLEDYLVELEKITFSFDGGKTKVNFAEASFLIQGTACVWSRKVESLHNLVYQTLEMIKTNRHGKQPSSVDNLGVDNDATFDDHEDKFLNLDDARDVLSKRLVNIGSDVMCISRHAMFFHGSEECRGSLFLRKDGEITNYYRDFWSNNMTPQQRGIVLVEQHFEKEISPPRDSQPPCSTEVFRNEEDAPADHFMENLDDVHSADDGGGDEDSLFQAENIQTEELQRRLRSRLPAIVPTDDSPTASSNITEPVDPHSESSQWPKKQFRKGKTLKLLGANLRKRKKVASAPSTQLLTDFLLTSRRIVHALHDPELEEKKIRISSWKQLKALHGKHKLDNQEDQDSPDQEPDNVFLADDDVVDPFDDENDGPELRDLINDVEENNARMDPLGNERHSESETYEDLVRHHVERFYTSSKQYVQESALSQRVKEWRQTVDTFLVEQETRPEFDIHKYGDDMVGHFTDVGETKPFRDCVSKENRWSICRRFAATLQLANDGNFFLSSEDNSLQDNINIFQLKLLSLSKVRERIGDYAPV